jgi:hypothetical protein
MARRAGLMSPSVQAEARWKTVAFAAAEQKVTERAVRIGHKTHQPAALRNWYKIPAWHYPWEDFLDAGCNCTSVGESVKETVAIGELRTFWAGLSTMHFGGPIPSNIYPVGLSMVLAKTKVYTVKH